jgi:uncharacterized protein YjbI with pentapeptide repeats
MEAVQATLTGPEAYQALLQGRALERVAVDGPLGPEAHGTKVAVAAPVTLLDCAFHGPVHLSDHVFEGPVVAARCRFLGPQIHFWRTRFAAGADFSAAEFGAEETLFSQAQFHGPICSFAGARFTGKLANFRRVGFEALADFRQALFEGERLWFRESRFAQRAELAGARFLSRNETSFRMAEFLGPEADFHGATFDSHLVDFNETVLAPRTRLTDCKVGGHLVLCNVDMDRLLLRGTDLARAEFRSPLRYRTASVCALARRRIIGDELHMQPGEELGVAQVYRRIRAFYLQRALPYEADWMDYVHRRDAKAAWEIHLSELEVLRRAHGALSAAAWTRPYAALRALLARSLPMHVGTWHVAPR